MATPTGWATFTVEGRSFHVKAHRVFAVGQQVTHEINPTTQVPTGETSVRTCVTIEGLGTLPIEESVADVAEILEVAQGVEYGATFERAE